MERKKKIDEHQWLSTHPGVGRRYKDEYVAVLRNKIIAHGKKLTEVIDKAETVGQGFLLAYIADPGEDLILSSHFHTVTSEAVLDPALASGWSAASSRMMLTC